MSKQTTAFLSFLIKRDVSEDSFTSHTSTDVQHPADIGMVFSVQVLWDFITDRLKKLQETSKVVLEAKTTLSVMKEIMMMTCGVFLPSETARVPSHGRSGIVRTGG